jgi:glycosylphosphatidylinositol phospholipase D
MVDSRKLCRGLRAAWVLLAAPCPGLAQVQTIPALSAHQEIAGGFGGAVAGANDLDSDGRGDFIVSAPGETVAGLTQGGRVYVHSGRIGLRLFSIDSPRNEAFGNFGWSVGGVPDANGDGAGDFVVGAPNENPAPLPNDTGRAYLFNGATGALIFVLGSAAPQAGGRFGYSVTGMTDVTFDGRGELLVGAPFETDGASPAGAGRVYQYNGSTGGRIRTFMAPAEQANARFGWSVAAVPDTNGDGRADIAIGAPVACSYSTGAPARS